MIEFTYLFICSSC